MAALVRSIPSFRSESVRQLLGIVGPHFHLHFRQPIDHRLTYTQRVKFTIKEYMGNRLYTVLDVDGVVEDVAVGKSWR
jgi:hypothetical protein